MKKIFTALLLVMSFLTVTAQKTEFSKKALNEKLITLEDSKIKFGEILKKHKGKTTVVEVWASWCGDCVKAMPKVKEMQANNPEVDYVFISMDKTTEKWKLGIEKHELKGAQFMANDGMKGAFGQAIDLDWIPRYIIIDKNGKIVV